MGEEQYHHRGVEINPIIVGLLGIIAGAIIVIIIHFVIVTWCKNTSSNPSEQNTTIPVSQSQNGSRTSAQQQTFSSTDMSTSTSNSMVQLIVLSRYNKDSKEDMCSICLGEFLEGDEVRVLSQCMHIFHVQCIDVWLHSHRNCPLCRADTTMAPSQQRLISLLSESHNSELVDSE